MAAFDYEHINLIPSLCIVASRSECDTTVQLGPHKFNLPVVPANMECVIDERIADNLATHGYFYILHRFLADDKVVAFCTRMKSQNLIVSISVGVNEPSCDLLRNLLSADIVPDFITIDIAHGHALRPTNISNGHFMPV